MINSNLEKRIIGVINDHKKQSGEKGMISRRLTAKKLQVKCKNYPHLFSNREYIKHCSSNVYREKSHFKVLLYIKFTFTVRWNHKIKRVSLNLGWGIYTLTLAFLSFSTVFL